MSSVEPLSMPRSWCSRVSDDDIVMAHNGWRSASKLIIGRCIFPMESLEPGNKNPSFPSELSEAIIFLLSTSLDRMSSIDYDGIQR